MQGYLTHAALQRGSYVLLPSDRSRAQQARAGPHTRNRSSARGSPRINCRGAPALPCESRDKPAC
jgi:hypothetical protein